MSGLRITRIIHEGLDIPDAQSLDVAYSGDDADFDSPPLDEGGLTWKAPVRVATTADITIATALNAGDTLDGVTLAAGDRVLVKDQGTGSQNGIYVVDASPYRAPDMDEDDEVVGAVVLVIAGTSAGTTWRTTNATAPDVDTDAITWASVGGGALALDDLTDVNAPTPSDGDVLTWDSTPGEWVALPAPGAGSGDVTGQLVGGADGGGAAVAAGATYYGVVPFTGTITDWRILGTPSGDVEFDVAVCAAGALPAFPGDSIVASAPPAMTGDTEVSGSTLTGWTTALTAGDNFAIKVESATTVTWASLTLNYSRP